MQLQFRNLCILFITTLICTGCSAASSSNKDRSFEIEKENGYAKCINDSVASIIYNARKVRCTLKSRNPADTLRKDTTNNLSANLRTLFKFGV